MLQQRHLSLLLSQCLRLRHTELHVQLPHGLWSPRPPDHSKQTLLVLHLLRPQPRTGMDFFLNVFIYFEQLSPTNPKRPPVLIEIKQQQLLLPLFCHPAERAEQKKIAFDWAPEKLHCLAPLLFLLPPTSKCRAFSRQASNQTRSESRLGLFAGAFWQERPFDIHLLQAINGTFCGTT